MMKPLHKLTLDEIRERVGHEPTVAEWVTIVRGAAAERDWVDGVEKMRAFLEVPVGSEGDE